MALGLLALAALAVPAQADHAYPDCFKGHTGADLFPLTAGQVTITTTNDPLLGPFAGKSDTLTLDGPTTVLVTSATPTQVQTEIVEMHLVGNSAVFGPIEVTESPVLTSTGVVTAAGGGSCFPATSTFNVRIQVDAPFLMHNHNANPLVMQASIWDIPPAPGDVYYSSLFTPVNLFSGPSHDGASPPGEFHAATMQEASHNPNNGEVIDVVFVGDDPLCCGGGGAGGGSVGGFAVPEANLADGSLAVVASLGLLVLTVAARRRHD